MRPVSCVVLIAVLLMVAGCGGSSKPLRVPLGLTVPTKFGALSPPQREAPSCGLKEQGEIAAGKGFLGACAPHPKPSFSLIHPVGGASGPDTSNNDPLYNWGPVRARGHRFGWTKLNQGNGFIDQTASRQITAIRRVGLSPGGYDFLEVCIGNPVSEAKVFLSRAVATKALGRGTLPVVGDAEWPLSPPCSVNSARAWIMKWITTVQSVAKIIVIYTGAWWWDPNIGCWWPKGVLSWISGYGVSYPAIPCGLSHLDFWQFSSSYPLTSNMTGDMSIYRGSLPSFNILIGLRDRRREHAELKKLDKERAKIRIHLLRAGCRVKHPRSSCRSLFLHGAQVNHKIRFLESRGIR